MSQKPIAITMGDPAGVGAEVIMRALNDLPGDVRARLVIIGDRSALSRAAQLYGLHPAFHAFGDTAPDSDSVALEQVDIPGGLVPFGEMAVSAGEASFRFVERATKLALAGEVAGIVTAPINKAALNAAGHHYDGHTGMLAALTGTARSFMLLASERLNVIHVSTHVSLRDAIDRATPERIAETIRAGNTHLKRLGVAKPRIAVAGINPHCGEGGLFGGEDDASVLPGVALARSEGIDAQGPIPADTVFHRAYNGGFDLVVAQYHDQGHIPIKLVAFDTAVNVTLGLPIDRTSVDHGTAFDIAGKGKANHGNMLSAIDYALRLAGSR